LSKATDGPLERLGVIGDIHGEHEHLEKALALLEGRGVDRILATGDIADGLGSVDRCCTLLMDHDVVTVAGNHDRWLLANSSRTLPDATDLSSLSAGTRRFLERLPRMVELSTVGGLALLCHGLGPNDMAKVTPDDFGYALESNEDLQNLLRSRYFRWVINGHSHRRMVRAFPGVTIVNAGTLHRRYSSCFIEIDFVRKEVLAYEFDAEGSVGPPTTTVLE